MSTPGEQDKIEKLKKALYSQKGVSRNAHILDLNTHNNEETPNKWKEEVPEKSFAKIEEQTKTSLTKKILIFALSFFVICLATAGYIFLKGNNVISNTKIDISVVSPPTARSGDEVAFDVKIVNRNSTALDLVDLITEYPKGTRNPDDKTTELPRDRIPVGTIVPGETVTKTIKIVPFGEEGDKLSISLSLEYRLPDSSSVFNKDLSYEFIIGSSPVTLTIDSLKEINSNQDITLTATLVSNSSETLKNIILVLNSPFGFEMKEATPKPMAGKFVWTLGDIEPEGKRVITVKGKIIGESNQNRVFKWSLGTPNPKDPNTLSSSIAVAEHTVTIKKPFLGVDILVDKLAGDKFVVQSGGKINFSVAYENNLSVMINDIQMEARISGDIVDKRSLGTEDGFYDSAQNLLRWTKFEASELESLSPGKEGNFNAYFHTLRADDPTLVSKRNPYITIDLSLKGKRLSESGVPEEINSTVSKILKIQTDAKLSAQLVHSVGPIENEGEVPPIVGKKTEYTVVWSVSNNFNDLNNATVSAILPTYVTWTGVTSPASEKITYNTDSRQVTWDLGKVLAGTKMGDKKASFQVAITPSLGQVETVPVLVGKTILQATDSFTNTRISDSIKEMTTNLVGDPNFEYGDDRVGE